MADALWTLTATETARLVRAGDVSTREVTASVLQRIDAVNPRLNALVQPMHKQAMLAARIADEAQTRGDALGPLHGVPVTIKVNTDQQGLATTNGVLAARELTAETDSPQVANLKRAGAIIVGRSNTPAFSLRWFTDNAVHGRTLNPFDASKTPGGSSGGAAVATATGMGALGHATDLGGSIRYPAYACGVVGLRPTVGRLPAFNATAREERGITSQLMATQGLVARSIEDISLSLPPMSAADPRDPLWVPLVSEFPRDQKLRIACFIPPSTEPAVAAAVLQAAGYLEKAGCEVEHASPPDFDEAAHLWRKLIYGDSMRSIVPAIERSGDSAMLASIRNTIPQMPELDRDDYLALLARRLSIARKWSEFLDTYHVLLMPVSLAAPFSIDEDTHGQDRMEAVLLAQSPLLGTAMLGLPGLSVPTGMAGSTPMGVQLVATRFREDRCLAAGEIIESAAQFSALQTLLSQTSG
ncbi:MAG: amidase family protein [Beijerinckiaceae bacterium]